MICLNLTIFRPNLLNVTILKQIIIFLKSDTFPTFPEHKVMCRSELCEHREPRSRFTVLDPEELGVENPQKYWIFSIC